MESIEESTEAAKEQLLQIQNLEVEERKKFEEENKELIQTDKIHKTVVDITHKFKYELMRCVRCPIMMECSYPKSRLTEIKASAEKQANQIYEDEIALDNTSENVFRAAQKRDQIYEQLVKTNAHKVLKDDRCIFERKELMTNLQKFVDAGYDIADPRTYVILNELLGNILNSGRMNKAFTNMGLLIAAHGKNGPIYYSNPLLMHKNKVSELVIKALESLDRILKSDEDAKAGTDFIAHLKKELHLREQQKVKVIDALEIPKGESYDKGKSESKD